MMRALRAVSSRRAATPDFALWPTAAPARCTRRHSRPSSASARRSCRRWPVSSRRPGCCSLARSSTMCASAASSAATPISRAADARREMRDRSSAADRQPVVEWQRRRRPLPGAELERDGRVRRTSRPAATSRLVAIGSRPSMSVPTACGSSQARRSRSRAPEDRLGPPRGVLVPVDPPRRPTADRVVAVADFGDGFGPVETPGAEQRGGGRRAPCRAAPD